MRKERWALRAEALWSVKLYGGWMGMSEEATQGEVMTKS